MHFTDLTQPPMEDGQLQGKSGARLQHHGIIHSQRVDNKLRTASANSTPPVADSPGLRGSSPVLGFHLNGSSMPVVNGRLSKLKPQSHGDKVSGNSGDPITSGGTAGSPERCRSFDPVQSFQLVISKSEQELFVLGFEMQHDAVYLLATSHSLCWHRILHDLQLRAMLVVYKSNIVEQPAGQWLP